MFSGSLIKRGINELVTHESTDSFRYLLDEDMNDLIVLADEKGIVTCLINSRTSTNSTEEILRAIATEFKCDIQSEIELE